MFDDLDLEVELTVFNMQEEIGGRLATFDLGGRTYESGGTVIHPANKLVRDLVKELGN